MSNFWTICGRVLIGGVVLAVVTAIGVATGCAMPNASCRLGVDVSAVNAAATLSLVLVVSGIAVLGVVAYPIGAALSRRNRLGPWSMSLIGAVAALGPFLFLCFVAGISMADAVVGPAPGFSVTVGGFFGGGVLWYGWFRHLTPNSRGTLEAPLN